MEIPGYWLPVAPLGGSGPESAKRDSLLPRRLTAGANTSLGLPTKEWNVTFQVIPTAAVEPLVLDTEEDESSDDRLRAAFKSLSYHPPLPDHRYNDLRPDVFGLAGTVYGYFVYREFYYRLVRLPEDDQHKKLALITLQDKYRKVLKPVRRARVLAGPSYRHARQSDDLPDR